MAGQTLARVGGSALLPPRVERPLVLAVEASAGPRPAPRWPLWALGGVAVASAAGGAALWALAGKDYRASDAAVFGADTRSLYAQYRTEQVAADVLGGVAVSSAVAAGLFAWSLR